MPVCPRLFLFEAVADGVHGFFVPGANFEQAVHPLGRVLEDGAMEEKVVHHGGRLGGPRTGPQAGKHRGRSEGNHSWRGKGG